MAEIRALLISPDTEVSTLFARILGEFGIATQSCADETQAAGALFAARFEALVLDFDNVSSSAPIIQNLRESSSSKDAIVFALATEKIARQTAFAHGANFAFERPFMLPQIRQSLQTAHALMLRDRRRYFRFPVECPVRITKASGQELQGTTINMSGSGMAVTIPCILQGGERLDLSFYLAEADLAVNASGAVVWDDKHGKAGLSFECTSGETGKRLAAWLDAQFYRRLKLSNVDPCGQS